MIYYFGTKDSLLTEAIRFSEDAFYELGARRMEALATREGQARGDGGTHLPAERPG